MLFKTLEGPMDLGLFALNMEPTVEPDDLISMATLAEDLGYESLWMGEHLVLPDPPGPHSPFDPRLKIGDPLVTLAFIASVTQQIRLATGVIVLPQRNPVALAKQLASLDLLAKGRLILGVGMGYIEPELAASGVPFRGRAERGREYLEAMRSLWHEESPSYHGDFVGFDRIAARPRPVQKDLAVVMGGHTPLALRRAVTHAHGWYGFGFPPDEIRRIRRRMEAEALLYIRPHHLGPLDITVTPPRGTVTPMLVEQYRRAGAHRIVLFPPEGITLCELEIYMRRHGARLEAV